MEDCSELWIVWTPTGASMNCWSPKLCLFFQDIHRTVFQKNNGSSRVPRNVQDFLKAEHISFFLMTCVVSSGMSPMEHVSDTTLSASPSWLSSTDALRAHIVSVLRHTEYWFWKHTVFWTIWKMFVSVGPE